MKTYKIAYATYPFNVETVRPKFELVEAKNLEEAFEKVAEKYGDTIEIFKAPARKFYNEPEID
jgi:hypothetical protein